MVFLDFKLVDGVFLDFFKFELDSVNILVTRYNFMELFLDYFCDVR